MKFSPKFFAIGLRIGIFDPKTFQTWLNTEIRTTNKPSTDLIELAYTKVFDINNLYSILSKMPDESDSYDVLKKLLGSVNSEKLGQISYCKQLAKNLYFFWVENDYKAPDELASIGFFDDEYDLASEGVYGSLEKWHLDFKIFISSFVPYCK